MFGPYHIARTLGEGGMGVVYLAERQDLGSVAAIKVLRDAWVSPERRSRFAAEQRTLAQLVHPGIARLYDAGALPDGTPWIAMEYVEGAPITEHCRARDSAVPERLRLFRAVCEAVQHAHRHLIVHRDLKPSNVLVTADAAVKLLDFGIAKHLDGVDIERTRTGVRPLTPAYAAPEQIHGGAIGVHTDVYGLGAILYELLTEQRPTGSAAAARDLMKPSSVSRRKAAWSDLDVLCLKAMHGDPARRYPDVEALIRDVDHYLKREPLEARPDAAAYRVRKFVGRNWRGLTATTAVIALLVGLVAFYTIRLTAARNTAVTESARTQRIQRFMLNLFTGGEEAVGPAEDLRVMTLVDRGAREARSLDGEPLVQSALYETLAGIYQQLGKFGEAESLLQSALDRRRSLLGADSAEVAETLVAFGRLRDAQASYDEAERLIRQGLDSSRARLGPADPAVARATAALGQVLENRGAYDKAIPVLSEAVRLHSAPGGDPADLAAALSELANTHFYAGHYAESESLNRRVLGMQRELYGDRHPLVADTLINLGAIQFEGGHYAEAERIDREALEMMRAWYGRDHPATASAVLMVGRAVVQQNRLDEAGALLREALEIQERVYGKVHPRVASALNELGLIVLRQGRFEEAEANFSRMTAIYREVYHDKHYYIGVALSNLGGVAQQRGDYRRAEALFRDVLQRYAETLPAEHQLVGIAHVRLGRALVSQRRFDDAEREILDGYRILQKQPSPPQRWVDIVREDLAKLPRPSAAAVTVLKSGSGM
jgi:eukaryotic-like serine/threonine-protein kinase